MGKCRKIWKKMWEKMWETYGKHMGNIWETYGNMILQWRSEWENHLSTGPVSIARDCQRCSLGYGHLSVNKYGYYVWRSWLHIYNGIYNHHQPPKYSWMCFKEPDQPSIYWNFKMVHQQFFLFIFSDHPR